MPSDATSTLADQARQHLLKYRKLEAFDEARIKLATDDESFRMMTKRVAWGRVNTMPFILEGRGTGTLSLVESPGVVILRNDKGEKQFTDVTVDGQPIESRPVRKITADGVIVHKITRSSDGKVVTIDSSFQTAKPDDTATEKHLVIASVTKRKFWHVRTLVAGSYTISEVARSAGTEAPAPGAAPAPLAILLGPHLPGSSGSGGNPGGPGSSGSSGGGGGGGGSNSGGSGTKSSTSKPSSSSGSSSKSAIVPFGDSFIGWEIAESPSPRNQSFHVVPIIDGRGQFKLEPYWMATTTNSMVRSVCATGQPAICYASVEGNVVDVFTSLPAPLSAVVVIEGDAAGEWSGPRFREFPEDQVLANNAFWASAHGEA